MDSTGRSRTSGQLGVEDGRLQAFIFQARPPSFGEMITCIEKAMRSPNSLLNGFLHDRFSAILDRAVLGKLWKLARFGNDERREDLDPQQATQTRALAACVVGAINSQ